MALSPGTILGPYEVLAPAGAGGMGEVYRARDTRLNRIVALKVMPAHLAGDPALRERFDREARAISHLNHPNICTLHDVGSDKGVGFLVMEYLEGETLAELLTRGPLPLSVALPIALQIASALERAHDAGIVHRDLKPSNIFLLRRSSSSAAPVAKLLDFGLAKSVSSIVSPTTAAPTVAQALTGQGTILGTLQYMAPEQLEGREADARADVFAFGALLYEMLAGKPAFSGKSQASVIASILTTDPPPVSSQQPVTPRALDHLIERALAKDPADRWSSMHDVLLQLQWIAKEPTAHSTTTSATTTLNRRERLAWIGASGVLVAALGAAVTMLLRPAADTAPVIHFELYPPEGTTFLAAGFATVNMSPALSHDGAAIIVPAIGVDGVRRLWLRQLHDQTPRLLEGTENANSPFWSPDDQSIAFFADGKLFRLDLISGKPRIICDAPLGFGGSWNQEGVIIFSPASNAPIHRVSALGGAPTAITTLDQTTHQVSHRFPQFLPDGRHFLFLSRSTKPELSAVMIASLDTSTTTTVMPSHGRAVFVPPNWLAYQSGVVGGGGSLLGTLMVQPFDLTKPQVVGEPRVLRQNIVVDQGGQGAFSFSDRGKFAYRAVAVNRNDTLNWYDRTGRYESTVGDPGDYTVPRLSPDGRKLAVATGGSIWVRDLTRGTVIRLTSGPAHCCPVWSPDGLRIAFRSGVQDIAIKGASGATAEEVVLANGAANTPTQWTPDGAALLYQTDGGSRIDTMLLPLSPKSTPKPLLQSSSNEEQAEISPDGRWIAFTSDESGQPQVYVQDYPNLADKWPVSTKGGADPHWRADGSELFFIAADRKLMAVPIKKSGTFEPGIPTPLFQTRVTGLTDVRTHYQVSVDGQRFLIDTIDQGDRGAPMQIVVNWPSAVGK